MARTIAGLGTTPTRRPARQYPTTPPPLLRDDIIQFGQRRRAATRGLQEAEAHRAAQQGRLQAGFEQFRKRLDRDAGRQQRSTRESMAGRGLAFSPRGLGRGLRDIRDWQADELGEAKFSLTEQLAALDEAVAQARRARDEEHAHISADEARRRTDLDRLIRAIGV